jgi:hypothetical protein
MELFYVSLLEGILILRRIVMLINVSNHSSEKWSPEQLKSAQEFGEIIDLGFPNVSPELTSIELEDLVDVWFAKIWSYVTMFETHYVHLMGETGFITRLATRLREHEIHVIHSTTARVVEEKPDGTKVSIFRFVRFRDTF